ncbi:MAG TPA: nitroreductase family protein [Tepidisphaeraceae bacterium]|jgi:nitroreductase|nr:nitroreductase family protein [Tepidisphaeraceae bacterium]
MEKPAQTDHEIAEILRRRWSPRAFANKPVEREKLLSILEAARWAASSSNEQPWSYIVATADQPAEFAKMVDCLVPGNQIWAKHAPVLMISVVKTIFSRNGTPNRVAMHDVGAASAQLTAEAMTLGLFVHQMGGIELGKIKIGFALPDNHEPVAALAVGYPGEVSMLPDEKLKEREMAARTRKPLMEFIFTGKFGQPRQ